MNIIKYCFSEAEAWSWWLKPTTTDHTALNIITLTTIIISVLTLTWLVLSSSIKKKHTPPLPPGPRGLPLLGNLLSIDPNLHTYFTNLSQTYGPIFTLKFGQKIRIVINSPALAKQVLKDQDVTFANREVTAASREVTYGGVDMASSPYGPEWRMLRKVCVRKLLSNINLDSIYELRRRELRRTIKYLYEKNGSSPVDFGEVIFSMLLSVMMSMLWGRTLKDDKERASVGAEFKEQIGEIVGLLLSPNVSDFYPCLARFDFQGIQKKMRGLAKRLDNIFESVIQQRISQTEKGDHSDKDFLQVLLKMKDKEGDGEAPFTMTQLKALLVNIIMGGTDSTSTTIEFTLAELMNHPQVLQKVVQELDRVVGKDRKVEESDIHKLHYLSAVMKEVLRLHPIVPLLVPHSPSMASNVGGYTIPKGSSVFINAWAIHRDRTLWENPTQFLPQRFIDAEWDYSGNDFRYIPFGSGRRICVGTAMAERMFMYSMASLLHSFHWTLPAGEKFDMSEKFGIVMKMKNPLVVIATPRLSDPSLYD